MRAQDPTAPAEAAPEEAVVAAEPVSPEPPPEPQDAESEGVEGEVSEEEFEREVAALLFASPEPLTTARLSGLLSDAPKKHIEAALAGIGARFARAGLPYEVRAIAGGWQLFTTPDLADTVAALAKVRKDERVSPAALETLAVVSYRQPVTKAEIEAIRGVQVGPILRALVDRGLVRVTGRSSDPGHALLYGTTRLFLDVFGLSKLEDLPRDGELMRD